MRPIWHAAAVLFAIALVVGGGAQFAPAQTGCLSFHEVHASVTAQEAAQIQVPDGFRIYPSADPQNAQLLLRETPVVSGGEVADAQPGFDARTSQPIVNFRFNAQGARKFGSFTRHHVGRTFAIVLDGQVISAPVIREPIIAGVGQISGNFTIAEAQRTAAKLKSGTCP